MSKPEKPPADGPERGPDGSPREERLARALRANLGRRKAQARERTDEPAPESPKRA